MIVPELIPTVFSFSTFFIGLKSSPGVAAPSLQEEGSGDMPILHSYRMECGSRAGILS